MSASSRSNPTAAAEPADLENDVAEAAPVPAAGLRPGAPGGRGRLAPALTLLAVAAATSVAACDDGGGPLEPDTSPVATDREAHLTSAAAPGTVTDLEVVSAAEGTVVLAFTEVADGAGQAASYDVRFTPTPMGWGWGRASSVAEGTCAAPLRGSGPGSRLECTVEGLEVGASYDFRLVAYRGTLNLDAVFGRLSNVATGTVLETARDPGTVDDLEVTSTSATSATLRFTEVENGAGGAAAYDVRYAPHPIGWGWGRASRVEEGSCAAPLRGDGAGGSLECTVEGLTSGEEYDFQLVAYRGTLNVDAAFGDLSNVATAAPPRRNASPTAEASASCSDRTCAFDGSGSGDSDGSIASWRWRFGDGTGASGSKVRHEYADAGEYEASLVVTDDAGAADTTLLEVRATDPVPVADPGRVSDLRVASTDGTSAVLTFTEVDDGAGGPASYDLRYTESPMGWGWGASASVEAGSCASPLRGRGPGSTLECTVEGLAPGVTYDFRAVAFRGTLDEDAVFGELSNVATGTTGSDTDGVDGGGDDPTRGTSGLVDECGDPDPDWIWCDDFDRDRLASYFEHASDGGSFVRASSVGVGGSSGMRARWRAGQVSAGSLKLAVGRTPQASFRPADDGTRDYRELYWRIYVKNEAGWTGGGGNKLSRATVLASSSSWAQAMIAHVWSGSEGSRANYLVVDPASGTDAYGNVVTTKYNDFQNLRWLGADRGSTPLFADDRVGRWYCVEARVRLNDRGSANGEFQLWIDGALDAERTGLDWVGRYDDYGINAVFLENYWNAGAPKAQERYIDNFVVSTERIGCES